MNMTSERRAIHFSEKSIQALREAVERSRERNERIRNATPICPDGSGEIGTYDLAASEYFGVTVYSTASKKYFRSPGEIIPAEYVPDRLK